MSHLNRSSLGTVLVLASLAVGLAACSSVSMPQLLSPSQPQPPAAPQTEIVPLLPPAFPPRDVVGRWGLAAYHKDEDRPRIQTAAANQCSQPYVISLGPSGGVMMHLADQAKPEELRLKGAPGGKTYIGPAEDPPGGAQDREVLSFDGRVMVLRWMDPEIQGRYGTMVYVRCGAEGAKRPGKAKAKPKAAPKAVQPPIQNAPPPAR
ncbi:MAG TPA: hypothetical protein VGF53_13245 [Pseudolabrys sp.]